MHTFSTAADSHSVSKRVGPYTFLHCFLTAIAAWRLRSRQRAQLYALSDRTLKDIGVSRWEIDGIICSPNRNASGRVRSLELGDHPVETV